MPSTSCAAAATFATASANGTSAGSAARAPAGGNLIARDDERPPRRPPAAPGGRARAARRRSRARAGHKPAVDSRGDVVGMALDLGRPRVDLVAAQRRARTGGRPPSGRRRSPRRWSPGRARAGSGCVSRRRDPVGRVKLLEGADAEVRAVAGNVSSPVSIRELARPRSPPAPGAARGRRRARRIPGPRLAEVAGTVRAGGGVLRPVERPRPGSGVRLDLRSDRRSRRPGSTRPGPPHPAAAPTLDPGAVADLRHRRRSRMDRRSARRRPPGRPSRRAPARRPRCPPAARRSLGSPGSARRARPGRRSPRPARPPLRRPT